MEEVKATCKSKPGNEYVPKRVKRNIVKHAKGQHSDILLGKRNFQHFKHETLLVLAIVV